MSSKTIKRINSSSDVVHEVRYGLKGILLYLLPIPVLVAAIIALLKGMVFKTVILALAFTAFIVCAIMARHGLKLQSVYEKKKLVKAPRTPYKTVAALLLALTTAVTAYLATSHGLMSSILLGGAAFTGFTLSYGLDPRNDKSGNIAGVSLEEVIDALEVAEIKINAIDTNKRKIKNDAITQQLDRITGKAREILSTIESDPKDYSRARKFLKVYLDGAERVTEKYANTYEKKALTSNLDEDFGNVLNAIEDTFNKQHEKLKENDQFDLDVQIEVLETQLKHDGVRWFNLLTHHT